MPSTVCDAGLKNCSSTSVVAKSPAIVTRTSSDWITSGGAWRAEIARGTRAHRADAEGRRRSGAIGRREAAGPVFPCDDALHLASRALRETKLLARLRDEQLPVRGVLRVVRAIGADLAREHVRGGRAVLGRPRDSRAPSRKGAATDFVMMRVGSAPGASMKIFPRSTSTASRSTRIEAGPATSSVAPASRRSPRETACPRASRSLRRRASRAERARRSASSGGTSVTPRRTTRSSAKVCVLGASGRPLGRCFAPHHDRDDRHDERTPQTPHGSFLHPRKTDRARLREASAAPSAPLTSEGDRSSGGKRRGERAQAPGSRLQARRREKARKRSEGCRLQGSQARKTGARSEEIRVL